MTETGFRDMHAHFIYGVDDGASSLEEMKAMIDMAHENGVTDLYATSHFTPGIRHFPETHYQEHFREAEAYCREQGYPIRLHTGTEILYTPALRNYLQSRQLRTLDGTEYALMEFVPDIGFSEAEEAVSLLEEYGYVPILAHVERYPNLYGPKIYRLKREHNVLYQMNCQTVIRDKGWRVTHLVKKWLGDELIDYISSDMHDTGSRRGRMREAYELLSGRYDPGYLKKLLFKGEKDPV